ncbi:unnamed protein product [Darwinula stevensoni]|uniref:Uncharacterized protein n=1 Tax=Darwinula stevensoni TaxID=69355 RepID=A0A7R9AAJ6_9CRUS|nr:unnamed protein product [Darwinula stevensoni]CAG0898480.1 unnamed protein product [Darwinula stevensoni]
MKWIRKREGRRDVARRKRARPTTSSPEATHHVGDRVAGGGPPGDGVRPPRSARRGGRKGQAVPREGDAAGDPDGQAVPAGDQTSF